MRDFFHADTDKYNSRLKALLIIVLVPLFAVCVFCVVNIILNVRASSENSFSKLMLFVIVMCVATGMIFTFTAVYFTEKIKRRHSRFTYFDILPKGMIYSVYAGEYFSLGERVIYRRLYYIPFSGFKDAQRFPQKSPGALTIHGEIHAFLLPSDTLGYHVDENGEVSFDNWELNSRGFTALDTLEIKDTLGNTKRLLRSIEFFCEVFRSIPPKKAFDIADYIVIKKRHKVKTSNPVLEAPSFDRSW